MIGTLGLDAARGVSILQNELRSCYIELNDAAVLTDKCDCEIDAENREISIRLSATLAEGDEAVEELELALKNAAEEWVSAALTAAEAYGCDLFGIGVSGHTSYNVNVSAEVGRSFDIENTEGGQ